MSKLVVVDPVELATLIQQAVHEALDLREPAPEWLDTSTAAALLGLHPKTVARMARKSEVPARRVGRSWRFKRSDVIALLEDDR